MKRTGLSLALLFASAPLFAGTWTDLWLTPDQQGQRLLDAGEAGEAAQRFQDSRLRAYADAKAGNYDSAAQQLAPMKDVDSLYNRGNALAHAGKLKEALGAYDAALAKAPDHRDARHNRDLVERQLQKQNHAQQKGQQGKPGANGQQNDKSQQGSNGQPGNKDQQGQQQSEPQQSGSQQGSSQQGSSQQGSSQQGSSQPNASQQNNSPQNGSQQNGSQQRDSQGRSAQSADDKQRADEQRRAQGDQQQHAGDGGALQQQTDQQQAAAARRDAEAALQRSNGTQPRVAGSQENQQPTSEEALAREHWLRRIPEDPGGLLRRKFMVEHMKKQQQESQQ